MTTIYHEQGFDEDKYFGTDRYDRHTTISDAIAKQSRDGGWICPDCWNYGGGVRCKKNVFIAFVGAYLKGCWGFDDKPRRKQELDD